MTGGVLNIRDRMLRSYLYPFVGACFDELHPTDRFTLNWHIDAMCYQLTRVETGECRRLLITVPPRHLKSITTAVAFVAWLLGRDPGKRIMVASYGDELATKHGEHCRAVMTSAWYRRLFPGTVLTKTAASELLTIANGGRKAVSLGGAVTGFGADILILDDMMKAGEAGSVTERQRVKDYYDQTLFSRLNDKQNGAIVAIQQRLHEDDLAAYLLDKGDFEHLNLRAIAEEDDCYRLTKSVHHRRKGEALFPAREPIDVLDEIRSSIGPAAFAAQYQQYPVPPGGNRFRMDWVKTYDLAPERSELLMVAQSWDTATSKLPTADWSVCSTWGLTRQGIWLLLDVDRDRLEYPDLKHRVLALQRQWQAETVLIEDAAAGRPLVQELRRDQVNRRLSIPHNTFVARAARLDKETRFDAQTAKIQEGRALFPTRAHWLTEFWNEFRAFPKGRYDDQVDSVSQFLEWTGSREGEFTALQAGNGGVHNRPVRILRPRFTPRTEHARRLPQS